MASNIPIESEQPELVGNSVRPTTICEEDVLLAITRQELELEQARHSDITCQVRDIRSRLEELAQDEASQQEPLRRSQSANWRAERAARGITTIVNLEQSRLDDGQRLGAEVISEQGGPAVESAAGDADGSRQTTLAGFGSQGAETQIVPRRTDRNTRFNFQEFVAHEPDKEHQGALAIVAEAAAADGGEPKRTIRIDFVHVEPGGDSFVISDVVEVDQANSDDLARVRRIARDYMRKGYYLFDKERNQFNPTDCFRKVVDDGTHMIVLQRILGDEHQEEDSSRAKRRR
ncbi:hypothetical protein VFPPC_01914 [Pochonia chlamydosporia 170]|uniref:Uncharacterized protein n=1 Tax=Pochonia chlamydosporia 170 TaxID=1380566 RepID=A0A179F6U0_METCM|nr:hypothetical protein VFPPC_01914 [Pochonia chlamydosporia 170]OAQ60873.2 hypothetical protein VFPPC_01914 [Pochonia chlamydosporia 170]